MLKEIISVLVIIFLVLAISVLFLNYNPVSEIKEKIEDIKYERSLNKTIIDDKELIIDSPEPFPYNRFREITYDGMSYEEDENSDFLVISFTDNSGYLNDKCFRLYRRTIIKDFPICDSECSNKTKGKLYCDLYDYLHNPEEGTLIGKLIVHGGGKTQKIEVLYGINDLFVSMIKENAEKRCEEEGIKGYCDLAESLK